MQRLEPLLGAVGDLGMVEAAGEDRALADARLGLGRVGERREERAARRRGRRGRQAARRGAAAPPPRPGARAPAPASPARSGRGGGAKSAARRARISRSQWPRSEASAMRARCARSRASRAARRSGLSSTCPSVSRAHSRSTTGFEAASTAAIAASPPLFTTSSGSCPAGMTAKRSERVRPEVRQREVDQPLGGGEAGAVAVEGDDGLGRELPQRLELGLGDRGAERRDGVVDAGLGERDHVHVALGDDDRAALARRGPRRPDVVERAALVEERRVGRVQVLRLLPRGDRPRAEGDAAAAARRGSGR